MDCMRTPTCECLESLKIRKTRNTRTTVKEPLFLADSQLPSVCWMASTTKNGTMANTSKTFIILRQKTRFDGHEMNRNKNSTLNQMTQTCDKRGQATHHSVVMAVKLNIIIYITLWVYTRIDLSMRCRAWIFEKPIETNLIRGLYQNIFVYFYKSIN